MHELVSVHTNHSLPQSTMIYDLLSNHISVSSRRQEEAEQVLRHSELPPTIVGASKVAMVAGGVVEVVIATTVGMVLVLVIVLVMVLMTVLMTVLMMVLMTVLGLLVLF